MNSVYINGVGILSRCAKDVQELKNVYAQKEISYEEGKLDFSTVVPASKLRRASRYNKMLVAVAEQAKIDAGFTEEMDKSRIGTIISSGFGAVESNIQFSDSVAKKNPALCSPTVFSGTVPNSCVGQLCILNGYKGVSTILMGGDVFEYSSLLLNTQKADKIFCGSIEEYSEELTQSVSGMGVLKKEQIAEGCSIMLMQTERTAETYCKLSKFGSASFGKSPYIYELEKGTMELVIEDSVEMACEKKKPDVVFTSANGSYFDDIELSALKKIFGDDVIYISPKELFGETFGSAYAMSMALAAVSLKNNVLPYKTGKYIENVSSILVTGIDTVGNYMCTWAEV